MDDLNNGQNIGGQADWDDDSGEIHNVTSFYNTSSVDGWQDNHAIYGANRYGHKTRKIKGDQVGFRYQTDDYRKVMPGYIIGTLVLIALCIVVAVISPLMGILFGVFGIVWIVGMWKNAPTKKWKNQSEKLKQDKERNQ